MINAILNFLKANWKMLLIGAIFLFLAFIMLRRCTPSRDTSGEKKEVDSLVKVVNQQRSDFTVAIVKKQTEIDSISEASRKTQLEANKAQKEIRRLIARSSEIIAKAPAEIKQDKNFDSLASVNQELALQVADYIDLTDTISTQYQKQLDAKDSIIALQGKLLFDLQNKFVDVTGKYYQLQKDYVKVEKKRKRNNTLNRVLAGALIVAGGIAIAK